MKDLSIVTLTYNSANQIGNLLDSISKSKDKLTKEIIVVDNASQDDTLKVIARHPSQPRLITLSSNLGFSKGVNRGIKQSTGDYILLLNPDTQIIGNCLQTMVDFARSVSPLGAVAPRLLDPSGVPQASAFHFPSIKNAIKRDFFNVKSAFGKYLPTQNKDRLEVAVMAALLIPRSTLDTVGLLDERFFLYYEDVEFCRRLWRHRLPIYYLKSAKVKHVHGASGKFTEHHNSPLLKSSQIYYGNFYSHILNMVLWLGHKWQVIIRKKRFRD